MKKVIPLLLVALGIAIAGYFYIIGLNYVETEKAYVFPDVYNISTDIGSKVVDIYVEVGDTVNPNDTLLLLDTTELHLQKAALLSSLSSLKHKISSLRHRLSILKSDYEYYSKMVKIDGASEYEYRRSKTLYLSTLEELEALNKNAEEIISKISVLNEEIKQCILLSPVKGVVENKYAQKGEMVKPYQPLISLISLEPYILAYIGEERAEDIKAGLKCNVKFVGYNKTFECFVERVEPDIYYDLKEDRRYIKVRVKLKEGGVPINRGMTAKVKIYVK